MPVNPLFHDKSRAMMMMVTSRGTWGSAPNGSPTTYLLTLTMGGVNAIVDWKAFDVLWGNQTCANDTQYIQAAAPAPLPASVFLLGSGILGLGLVGWRRKKAETLKPGTCTTSGNLKKASYNPHLYIINQK
ncbi:MAG: VPLPA-CTERM sorting domain-containing protein, partial [Desulfobaccales bacterium]